ncbi:MAG: insulinase family protein, partial [Phycisphaerae bacterium]|nr:insulinase family protein [Phycisphaerae bacterium]
MHRTLPSPLLPLLSVVLAAGLVAPCAWAQGLPSDPALVTGQLDNGLRYIIRQHDKPPGRAVIWLQVHSGSLNETDPQRGIAHYLEHMAFNGSKNFPPGSVVPFFQSLGMTFGRDQNAFTSFDQTTYQLSLPSTDAETLGKGLTFFADVLHRLSLLPDEIEAERQIILEERRSRLSGRQRTGDYVRERTAPGSLYGVRSPIGVEETIRGVGPADFRAYYEKWYAASNATLMVVADAPPADVIAAIKAHFADAPKRPRPAPQPANVRAYDKSFAVVASDPEIRFESLDIMRVEPPRPPTTTVEQYRMDLVDRLGQSAFNRRLGDKVSRGGTAYQNARVSSGTQANIMHSASLSTGAAPGKWREALEEIALELQRARAFGFTSREIDDARRQMISSAERAVETEGSQQAQAIISRINSAVAAGEPILSPRQRLELLEKLLPTITVEQVSQRFAQEFDPKAVAFVAVLPAGEGVPGESELLELGLRALAQKPAPEAESARATELMSAPPTPGKISDGVEHSASGVWSGWLSNNVRVHHRFMDERKNDVSISISLIGGELHETAGNRGITQAAQLAWSRPATRKLSSTDIRELMTGKKISVGGAGGAGRGGGR